MIKRNTSIAKTEQVGMGIIDIVSKFNADIAPWMSKIQDENSVTHRTPNAVMRQY